jgi:AraC-like DNA-binding protein
MLLYLSLLGVLMSMLLVYFNGRRFKSSIYLSIFFFLVSVYGLSHYIFVYARSPFWIAVFYVHSTFLSYLTGPMAYFYVRSLIRDNVRLSYKDLLHFLPALLHVLISLSYWALPFSEKLVVGTAIAENVNYVFVHKANLFTELTGANMAMYLSRPLLAVCYTFASIVIWRRHLKRVRQSPLVAQRRVIQKWVICFLSFQLLLFLGFAIALLQGQRPDIFFHLLNARTLQMIVAFSLVGLLMAPFLFPQVLYGLPDFSRRPAFMEEQEPKAPSLPMIPAPLPAVVAATPVLSATSSMQEAPAPIQLTDEGPATVLLDEEASGMEEGSMATGSSPKMQLELPYLDALAKEVDRYMEKEQPFLLPAFNMLKLAYMINVPAHHLSYLFREHKQISFNDYRNSYRVSYAQELIASGLSNELTLEAIGLKAGFASRSAFFKSFKKVTGQSPSEFIAFTQA